MLQLCYASTRSDTQNDLLDDLSNILAVARKFNKDQNIVGALYYAEGYFFQCLEGEPDAVNALFDSISRDRRHHEVLRFTDREIDKPSFSQWSMKYVHKHSEIASLFSRLGFAQFVPHQLEKGHLNEFLDLLYKVDENQAGLVSPQGYKQRGYVPYF